MGILMKKVLVARNLQERYYDQAKEKVTNPNAPSISN